MYRPDVWVWEIVGRGCLGSQGALSVMTTCGSSSHSCILGTLDSNVTEAPSKWKGMNALAVVIPKGSSSLV